MCSSDIEILEEIIRLHRDGKPSAMATVVQSNGSTPRKSGSKILVRPDGSIIGTIGGGSMEQEIIEIALDVMRSGVAQLETFELNERYGHVCGGSVQIYIEAYPISPALIIIGAGHVGRALTAMAHLAGLHVTVIDDRHDYALAEQLPHADRIICSTTDSLNELNISEQTMIVIATPSYETDFAAVRTALATPAGYIGVIGSKRKKHVLTETLRNDGYAAAEINRVIIPVGLEIGAETPQEIAVSILGQLIAHMRGGRIE